MDCKIWTAWLSNPIFHKFHVLKQSELTPGVFFSCQRTVHIYFTVVNTLGVALRQLWNPAPGWEDWGIAICSIYLTIYSFDPCCIPYCETICWLFRYISFFSYGNLASYSHIVQDCFWYWHVIPVQCSNHANVFIAAVRYHQTLRIEDIEYKALFF